MMAKKKPPKEYAIKCTKNKTENQSAHSLIYKIFDVSIFLPFGYRKQKYQFMSQFIT